MNKSKLNQLCLICTYGTQETRRMRAKLAKTLQKQIDAHNARSLPIREKRYQEGFKKILHILFHNIISAGQKCNHQSYHRYLLQKLKCSREVLNFVCQKLAKRLTEKNQLLDVMKGHFKRVQDIICQIDLFPELKQAIESKKPSQSLTQALKTQTKTENKTEIKPQLKTEIKPQWKAEITEIKPQWKAEITEIKPQWKTEVKTENEMTKNQIEGQTIILTKNQLQKQQGQIFISSIQQQQDESEQYQEIESDPCAFFGFLSKKKK